jgi:sugar lactone lactonase YvrE
MPTAEQTLAASFATEMPGRPIELVHAFADNMPTGVAVNGGRIFVSFPRWGDQVDSTLREIVDDAAIPYPTSTMNALDQSRPGETLFSVQAVEFDALGRLWLLDTGLIARKPVQGAPKMMAIDPATNTVTRTIILPPSGLLPTTFLNDLRFDLRHGTEGVAYITDSGAGGLIIVDLGSGEAWRQLDGHVSTQPDSAVVPVVEGSVWMIRPKGEPPRRVSVAADGIAISADGSMLYFCPMTSRRLYAVPTALLRDRTLPPFVVAAAVIDMGEKGASDGLESDREGGIYVTDYEHNAVRYRDSGGIFHTVAHDPRLLWPDTLELAQDGYLYITVNQLERQPAFHQGQDLRKPPFGLFRVKIEGTPILLR